MSRFDRPSLRAEELDLVSDIFGVVINNRGGRLSDLCDFYLEDDGHYHYKFSIAADWLDDLILIAEGTQQRARCTDE